MNIDEIILNADTEEVFLADSGWLTDSPEEDIEAAWEKHHAKFEELLPLFVSRLGEPDLTDETNPEWRDEIYCEAIRLAGWKHSAGYRLLAFGQHDRETPVFVSFGYRAA